MIFAVFTLCSTLLFIHRFHLFIQKKMKALMKIHFYYRQNRCNGNPIFIRGLFLLNDDKNVIKGIALPFYLF